MENRPRIEYVPPGLEYVFKNPRASKMLKNREGYGVFQDPNGTKRIEEGFMMEVHQKVLAFLQENPQATAKVVEYRCNALNPFDSDVK